ncbi:hypothetical protein OsI_07588 [Oryza sativa Indica Group]|uniref:Uncharacterized protein n=1 Tax=Oryza sativa subsp. indica TaxID=39946 RepID=A2X5V4_ORYSI|nr:hypothetical protein OsI_07588 [Oryza sativa Indica Group]
MALRRTQQKKNMERKKSEHDPKRACELRAGTTRYLGYQASGISRYLVGTKGTRYQPGIRYQRVQVDIPGIRYQGAHGDKEKEKGQSLKISRCNGIPLCKHYGTFKELSPMKH